MTQEQNDIARMCAITISREYGSGGGEIAKRVAQWLGWELIDHEAVLRIAKELGVSEEEAEAHDERKAGFLEELLVTMQGIDPSLYANVPPQVLTSAQDYREALEHVIARATEGRHVVIVGRGSQALLRDRRDVLHARIIASIERRIPYIMQREGVDKDAAKKRIHSKDTDRIRYLESAYNCNPTEAHNYDLVINTDVIDLDSAVDLIILALQRKARKLDVSAEALGPGMGLSRYPGRPKDFHPPTVRPEQES
jgi:cytidylate kinase